MLKIRFILYLFLLSFLIPTFVSAEAEGIKDYDIARGDTLWDISGKELSDPFLWPKIWKENPEIKNPDRVYPGQKIKIPIYLIQSEKPVEPAPSVSLTHEEPVREEQRLKIAEPEPAKISPLVGKTLFMSSGYITDSIPGAGHVGGSANRGFVFGNNDIIYIKTDNKVNIGDKFYIIRSDDVARHPVTERKIGHIISFQGIAEIIGFEYGETQARITQMFGDITSGDLLIPFFELNPPIVPKPYRKPHIESTIVGTKNFREMNSGLDIVYIDKGKRDGIESGDIFRTITVGKHTIPTGTIQIIHAREKTATAVVLESKDPIERGQLATYVE